ncbi:MAG: flagellar assembly protein FliH [Alphaproteobacteria bacterium]|nr:MAG: flagellar assembly protein FliH [Alphaproteobacteria bacterium]
MKTVKFTFDNRFDAPPKAQEPAEEPPTFSEEELAAAREAAYREGLEAGRAEVLAGIDQRVADATTQIAAAAQALAAEQDERSAHAEREAVTIAHAIARTLAPALAAREPLAEIEGMVRECLAVCYAEPRLVVRVAEDLVDPMKGVVDRITHEQSFAGKLILLGDDRLTGDQCRVEWADGGAERDSAALLAEIDRLVERHLNNMAVRTPSAPDGQPEQKPVHQRSENADVE